jgi:hypothetical protein
MFWTTHDFFGAETVVVAAAWVVVGDPVVAE